MRRPDFFIVGAQKAGTTSLAALLDAVPGISLSRPKEPMLFCFDDFSVHRSEFLHARAKWKDVRWERDRDELLARYERCFAHAPEGDLLGEASTTYAPSRRAAERIEQNYPEARIIMVLRNPVERAFSAYWHHVRKGGATKSFEEEIRFGGANLVEWGCYLPQLKDYVGRFGRDRVHVTHFEDLVSEEGRVLRNLLAFLEIDAPDPLPEVPRMNESYYPRFLRLHRLAARALRLVSDPTPHGVLNLPETIEGEETGEEAASASGLRGLYRKLAMSDRKPCAMKEETRQSLLEYFRRESGELSALLGEDVTQRWGWDG